MKAVIIVVITILLLFVLTKAASTDTNAGKKSRYIDTYQVVHPVNDGFMKNS